MAGTCVDACTGVTCPFGEGCTAGECVQLDLPDAAVVQMDANIHGNDAAILPGVDAGMTMPMMDGGTAHVDGGRHPTHSSDCGCRAGGTRSPWGAAWMIAIGALLFSRRRR
jgi:MYXO-CTERM domain-containing protein